MRPVPGIPIRSFVLALTLALPVALPLAGCSKRLDPVVRAEPPHAPALAAPTTRAVEAHATAPSSASPAASTSPAAKPTPAAPPLPPAKVEHFRVPGDRVASIVRAVDGRPPRTVFLPGICSNAGAYLQAFPEAARRQGGVVAIDGDQPCGNLEGFHSFSWDATRLHARIEAAVASAGLTEIPAEGLVLVGYSQGAALGEQLVQRWPERYSRVVLIGAPTDPKPPNFVHARGVVTMSCSRDVPAKMSEAARGIARRGIPATYIEMPGCTHGQIADGEATFDTAFDWLREHARDASAAATPIPLVGAIEGT